MKATYLFPWQKCEISYHAYVLEVTISLCQEVEEMLELFKSTWRILGITETIHYTCYAWVLFRQVSICG